MSLLADRPPTKKDSCVVCYEDARKHAALLYDKICIQPVENSSTSELPDIPPELTFGLEEAYGWIDTELRHIKIGRMLKDLEQRDICFDLQIAVVMAYRDRGFNVTPVFNHEHEFEYLYGGQNNVAWEACLNSVKAVTADNLDWQQILEFRKDKKALSKYRDLRLWLNHGLEAQSVSHAEDLISQKLENYEWAIDKHGMETTIGVLRFIVEPKNLVAPTILAAGASAFGSGLLGALAGGLTLLGQASVGLAQRAITYKDLKLGEHRDIAYIHEVKKKFKGSD